MVAWIPYEPDFRPPSPWEQAILSRLLEIDFLGRDELHEQVSGCVVRALVGPGDHEGTIEISVSSDVKAPVTSSVPVEGIGHDDDGMEIDFLLHIRDGVLRELEVLRADGYPLRKLPDPSDISVRRIENVRNSGS
jgi:hypothetical protein